jgi:hypothetical protein
MGERRRLLPALSTLGVSRSMTLRANGAPMGAHCEGVVASNPVGTITRVSRISTAIAVPLPDQKVRSPVLSAGLAVERRCSQKPHSSSRRRRNVVVVVVVQGGRRQTTSWTEDSGRGSRATARSSIGSA